nr:MAG TPA: hypothetical protein [Caudoviricetes sp.]
MSVSSPPPASEQASSAVCTKFVETLVTVLRV